MKMHHCQTEEETIRLACNIAQSLSGIVTLNGILGAGKSTFARTIIQTLTNSTEDVPSPTFTLVQEYQAKNKSIFHLDLYRLEDPEEIFELGWDEMQDSNHLILIEWAEKIKNYLPQKRTDITIKINDDESRTISIKGTL